jgi:tetratricopeptide (TPR) repeat protein
MNSAAENPANITGKLATIVLCALLAMAVFLVFGRTVQHEFVNYDDNQYVYQNPHVFNGLNPTNIAWAFAQTHSENWHPITWISHMLDCKLYGLKAGGHHLSSVFLHTLTAISLFLLLQRTMSAFWDSALVTALFAIHPLRAESVAWVSERKDVLSGLFFVLTLLAYSTYVRQLKEASSQRHLYYILTIALFACGLMSKPMLVTLPFVLLLLDYWPFQRISQACTWPRLVLEKTPLFLLSIISCMVTVVAQKAAVAPIEWLPLSSRIENAFVSYATYLVQLVYPVGLSVYYPHAESGLSAWKLGASAVFLVTITIAAWVERQRMPYLIVGWLWYLGMLIPVAGFVQVGEQARADRYTYLPHIGIYLILAFAIRHAAGNVKTRRLVLSVASAVAVVLLAVCAWKQTSYWQNSETLWQRSLSINPGNAIAHNNLGTVLADAGQKEKAFSHFQSATQLKPRFAEAHNNLGTLLFERGSLSESIQSFQLATKLKPAYAPAHVNLANALAGQKKFNESLEHYQKAIHLDPALANAYYGKGAALVFLDRQKEGIEAFQRALIIDPNQANVHYHLGLLLARQGESKEAEEHFRQVIRIKPDHVEGHYRLAIVLQEHRRFADAISSYEQVLSLEPDHLSARNNIAWILATCTDSQIRNGTTAIQHAQKALKLTKGMEPAVLDTLAAAYAEAGQFTEAAETARRAIEQVPSGSNAALIESLRKRLRYYEANKAYHE